MHHDNSEQQDSQNQEETIVSSFYKPHFYYEHILIVSLSSPQVHQFLSQHIFAQEGFLLEGDPKETNTRPFTYRFSDINKVSSADKINFPALNHSEKSSLHLRNEIAHMPNLKAIITLGITAHHATLASYHLPIAHMGHLPGISQTLPDGIILTHACHIPESFIANKAHLPERLKPLRDVLTLLREGLKYPLY